MKIYAAWFYKWCYRWTLLIITSEVLSDVHSEVPCFILKIAINRLFLLNMMFLLQLHSRLWLNFTSTSLYKKEPWYLFYLRGYVGVFRMFNSIFYILTISTIYYCLLLFLYHSLIHSLSPYSSIDSLTWSLMIFTHFFILIKNSV